jgi:internalin A
MTEEELLQIIEQAAQNKETSLNLSRRKLTKLPPEIGQLTNLTWLNLSENQLTTVPATIGQLRNLTKLSLSKNQLTTVPAEIGQLTNLTKLSLSKNQLTTVPAEIGQLTNLTELWLYENQLTTVPAEIWQLTNLTELYLYGNQLTTVPAAIGNLTNLTRLDLSKNQLTTVPAEIGQLTNLTKLSLYGNQLTTVPAEIGQLTNLTKLSLNENQLTTVPAEIGQLTNLTELYLYGNQLTKLPPGIWQLTNLTVLDLNKNQLTTVPAEIGQLTNLTELYLYGNQLTTVPAEIGQLTNLTELYLYGNQLTTVPAEIGQLTNLTELYLYGNQLTTVPAEIGQLTNLTELYLYGNQLTTVPAEIGQLTNLTVLSLSKNQLTTVPAEIGQLTNLTKLNLEKKLTKWTDNTLYLGGNPLVYPPPEILNQGIEATFAYLREALHAKQPQWISKLIVVGEGGVGKTSLIKALRGILFDPQESTTHGIGIRHLELPHPSQPDVLMQLNAWDFGGQQINHATHQFFLTNRSLFLLAWNARYGYEQGKLYYWLDTLTSLAPDSMILLVATHLDERTPSIPLNELQRQYPQIIGQCEISSKTGLRIDTLRHTIAKAAAQLPLMGEMWPKTWLDAANEIRSLPEKYISPQQLATRMMANGVKADSVPILAQWLHELGDILYFQNKPELNEIVILKPTWVTEHISRVLESETVKQQRGILTRAEMNQLWQDIDPFMREHFLHLMECFDLSYQIRNEAENRPQDASLIVECLPLDTPNYQPQWDAILTTGNCQEMSMKWQFNIVPAGIPTWFIARSHRFSTGIHWRNGVLLADTQPPKHLALIQAFPDKKSLQLTVRGTLPQNFFTLLRDGIELTINRFPGLQVKRTIPCSGAGCQSGVQEFDEQNLQLRYEKNRLTIECPHCLDSLSVTKLLFGLDLKTPTASTSGINTSGRTTLLLSRIDELEKNVLAGQTEQAQEMRELVQRQFTTLFRIEQEKIESHCPSVFTLHPRDAANWKTKLFGQKFDLQLYCEAPGEWHPVTPHGLYEIDVSAEWFKVMAPHIQQLAGIFKYVTPFVGSQLGVGNIENYERIMKRDIHFMEILATELPKLQGTDDLELLKNAGIDPHPHFDAKHLQGAALRVLRQLLEEKDPHQHWGGLTKVLTPEGHYLWLCDHHLQQYKK